MRKLLVLLPLTLYILIVYRPFIFQGKLPIPADTIVGLYYPWRDFYHDQFPNGVPFKNSLVTDAVRQEYPWRQLAIDQLKKGQLPLWNPFSFAGYPLLANMQSAPFYPLNFVYWLGDFPLAWSVQVLLQTVLGAVFMGLYLRRLRLREEAVALGSLVWAGSGFVIAWLTANVVVQAAIWLPLMLLATDQIVENKRLKLWGAILIFSLVATYLAGHLQVGFYVVGIWFIYVLWRVGQTRNSRALLYLLICFGLFIVIILPFIVAAAQFITLSARSIDQSIWQKNDWFIPWQNLAQFVAPDFLGNPTTLNYFGIFNYAEFVGYVGIFPLVLAAMGFLSVRRDKWFFGAVAVGALFMALPTPVGKLPFILQIPFVATAQPSRLLVVIDFSLAVLAAFGLDYLLVSKGYGRKVAVILVLLGTALFCLWVLAYRWQLAVSLRNLYLPTLLVGATVMVLSLWLSRPEWRKILVWLILVLVVADLSRFATKFLPFSPREYLFPETKAITFLKERATTDVFRIAPLDPRVMAQNFSTAYRLQAVSGYDPLYLQRYGEFIIAMERGKANFKPPFHFDRIVEPHNIESPFFDLLGVKYVLTLYDLVSPGYRKVFQEGETRVYENQKALPRAFFPSKVEVARDRQQAMDDMFDPNFKPGEIAVAEGFSPGDVGVGTARISEYTPNEVVIRTETATNGYLVLTDIYYPTWKATIDGKRVSIYATDFTFRGVSVPAGHHQVRFYL